MEDWITLDKTSGSGNETVVVSLGSSDTNRSTTLAITSDSGIIRTVLVEQVNTAQRTLALRNYDGTYVNGSVSAQIPDAGGTNLLKGTSNARVLKFVDAPVFVMGEIGAEFDDDYIVVNGINVPLQPFGEDNPQDTYIAEIPPSIQGQYDFSIKYSSTGGSAVGASVGASANISVSCLQPNGYELTRYCTVSTSTGILMMWQTATGDTSQGSIKVGTKTGGVASDSVVLGASESVTVGVTPEAGYLFDRWENELGDVLNDTTTPFTPDGNRVWTVYFVPTTDYLNVDPVILSFPAEMSSLTLDILSNVNWTVS